MPARPPLVVLGLVAVVDRLTTGGGDADEAATLDQVASGLASGHPPARTPSGPADPVDGELEVEA